MTSLVPIEDLFSLAVQGQLDDRVPLRAVFDRARPHRQPVVVVPGADHFFSGRLHVPRPLVVNQPCI